MKKSNEMRAGYDFATMKGGIRGKHSKGYREGTNLVLLEPDISEAFPTDKAVNQALRTILSRKLTSKGVPLQRRSRSKRG
jgi:hypothetical protein